MRARFVNEKFTEDGDPIQDMGIGMKAKLKQLQEKDWKLKYTRPEAKDFARISNIKAKAKGSIKKECMYAKNMAYVISDHYKAYRRYLAAKEIGGEEWEVTNIFLQKVLELFKIM